ncbi:hypothetical protein DUNSADRAFT_10393 [Dunaliella salina]|uniref:Encoded protein n=1 Tax=Dunaliella salina TaxID=3046 RepID=A0ABQ7GFG9_DUNSA|nr:hypothetical protein DUNSADRAFT_10393 [Dunaliella salina]|eukprot:KAF5833352.1 hypothetical protein DUNSADRAFT_10393 [Dunaliella salina]
MVYLHMSPDFHTQDPLSGCQKESLQKNRRQPPSPAHLCTEVSCRQKGGISKKKGPASSPSAFLHRTVRHAKEVTAKKRVAGLVPHHMSGQKC